MLTAIAIVVWFGSLITVVNLAATGLETDGKIFLFTLALVSLLVMSIIFGIYTGRHIKPQPSQDTAALASRAAYEQLIDDLQGIELAFEIDAPREGI